MQIWDILYSHEAYPSCLSGATGHMGKLPNAR
jgi:hypothetical protein